MKRYVIDTNALLSFVTDRNTAQQAVMTGVFEQVAAAQASILCPQNVIAEFVYVMDTVYYQPKPSIRAIVADFIAMPGVTIAERTDFDTVLTIWPEAFDDFGDAIVAATARATKGAIVVTFDRRYMRKLASNHIPFMGSKSR